MCHFIVSRILLLPIHQTHLQRSCVARGRSGAEHEAGTRYESGTVLRKAALRGQHHSRILVENLRRAQTSVSALSQSGSAHGEAEDARAVSGEMSRTKTLEPFSYSVWAALRPLNPPPTTMTCVDMFSGEAA